MVKFMDILKWIKQHWIYKPGNPLYTKSKVSGKEVTWFYIRAPHHLYLGMALLIMGWLSSPYYSTTATICYILGSLITLDDLVEHLITKNTPLRKFFEVFNFWLR